VRACERISPLEGHTPPRAGRASSLGLASRSRRPEPSRSANEAARRPRPSVLRGRRARPADGRTSAGGRPSHRRPKRPASFGSSSRGLLGAPTVGASRAVKALQQLEAGSPERAASSPIARARLARRDRLRRGGSQRGAAEMDRPRDLGRRGAREHVSRGRLPSGATGALLFGRYETVRERWPRRRTAPPSSKRRIASRRSAVAVKILAGSIEGHLDGDAFVRFEREGAGRSRSSAIRTVVPPARLPAGWTGASSWAWMSGGSLADWDAAASRSRPARSRSEIALRACSARSGEAHQASGSSTANVKPSERALRRRGGRLASRTSAPLTLGDLSSTATARGRSATFAYMSPEQRLGRPASGGQRFSTVSARVARRAVDRRARRGLREGRPSGASPEPRETRISAASHDARGSAPAARGGRRESGPPTRSKPAARSEAIPLAPTGCLRVSSAGRRRPARKPTDLPRAQRRGLGPPERIRATGRDRLRCRRARTGWLDRDVLVLSLDDCVARGGRARLRAGPVHAALPCVASGSIRTRAEIWIAAGRAGKALADEPRRDPPPSQARAGYERRYRRSFTRQGGAARRESTAEHLYLHDGEVTVAYPPASPQAPRLRGARGRHRARCASVERRSGRSFDEVAARTDCRSCLSS